MKKSELRQIIKEELLKEKNLAFNSSEVAKIKKLKKHLSDFNASGIPDNIVKSKIKVVQELLDDLLNIGD